VTFDASASGFFFCFAKLQVGLAHEGLKLIKNLYEKELDFLVFKAEGPGS